MELNETFFGNVSRDSDTDDFESDVEAKLNSFLMYLESVWLAVGGSFGGCSGFSCCYHHIEEQKAEGEI